MEFNKAKADAKAQSRLGGMSEFLGGF